MNPKLESINIYELAQKVITGLTNYIKTSDIDNYSAECAINLSVSNYEYQELASRIVISNHHKNTKDNFVDKIIELKQYNDNMINDKFYKFVLDNKDFINELIDYDRDYLFDYFGVCTLEKTYLLNKKIDDKVIVVERIQDLFMRVSIAIHMEFEDCYDKIKETYDLMSTKHFIFGSPALFNAASKRQQFSSCFLLGIEDSLDSILKVFDRTGRISSYSGGIGLNFSKLRSNGSIINGTNGRSNGIIPIIKMFDSLSCCVDQGNRRGSFAIFLEPHHADILDFIQLRRNTGDEKMRSRDISIGLWCSNLFFECVFSSRDWYLMDPKQSPGLEDVYGKEYELLYYKYVNEHKYVKKINAIDLWKEIWTSCRENGYPYILSKDNSNYCSNQNNIGIIRGSNLCCEILEYSDDSSYSVCNLSSICLPKFLTKDENNNIYFNYKKLSYIVGVIVECLNNIIDINIYPVEETKISNMNNRPIGIGIQGLHDLFLEMRLPFTSKKAKELNKLIMETIYYSALSKSSQLAKSSKLYNKYNGSHLSMGKFHWELYNELFDHNEKTIPSNMWNWDTLREHVLKFGVKNSLLIALMPTCSTSAIMGYSECFEAYSSNIYRRKSLAGDFIIINKYMMNDIKNLGLMSQNFINHLMLNNGSIQTCDNIPNNIKELYKTGYELSKKDIIEMAKDRQFYCDQSQSFNIFADDLTFAKFNSIMFCGYKNRLKTLSYYTRARNIVDPIKVTVVKNNDNLEHDKKNIKLNEINIIDQEIVDECLLCSS